MLSGSTTVEQVTNQQQQGYVVAFIIFLIIIYITYKARQWRQRTKGKRERHGLSEDVMENVLCKQNHRCAKFNRILNFEKGSGTEFKTPINRLSLCQYCLANLQSRRSLQRLTYAADCNNRRKSFALNTHSVIIVNKPEDEAMT